MPATSVERRFLSKPEKGDPRSGLRLLALAVLLTVSMFAWQLWHVYNSFRIGNQTLEMYAESERLRDQFAAAGKTAPKYHPLSRPPELEGEATVVGA